jgi:hypothetical protein
MGNMLQWIETLNADILSGLVKGSALLLFLVVSQSIIALLKFRLRRRFARDTKDLSNMEEVQEVSLAYFRRRQILDVFRAVLLLLVFLAGVLFYNIQAFIFLALALGAVVINQKENINSIIAYFYLLSNYNVGDDISTMGSLGEIVRISLFHTILAGKEGDGEYNGKRITIPNYQFLLNTTEQQDLKADTYRHVIMRIPYSAEVYPIAFDEFLKRTHAFLHELLPKRTLTQVGRYRGFAGSQYKINFDYDESNHIIVHLSFISRPRDIIKRKESIVTFLETLKHEPVTPEKKEE